MISFLTGSHWDKKKTVEFMASMWENSHSCAWCLFNTEGLIHSINHQYTHISIFNSNRYKSNSQFIFTVFFHNQKYIHSDDRMKKWFFRFLCIYANKSIKVFSKHYPFDMIMFRTQYVWLTNTFVSTLW